MLLRARVAGGQACLSVRQALRALAIVTLALLFLACEDATQPADIAGRPVWAPGEQAEYRLLDGRKEIGRALLSVEREGDAFVLRQEFKAERVTDTVAIHVSETDLKPRKVHRVVDGEDGRIQLDVEYVDGRAIVHADNGEERNSESNAVPAFAYDNWEGLFLWRTVPLDDDYRAAYHSMVTAVPRKPAASKKTIEVEKREQVSVPAGSFDTWKLKVSGGGASETAWIGIDGAHPVVKYDNGTAVFELLGFR